MFKNIDIFLQFDHYYYRNINEFTTNIYSMVIYYNCKTLDSICMIDNIIYIFLCKCVTYGDSDYYESRLNDFWF